MTTKAKTMTSNVCILDDVFVLDNNYYLKQYNVYEIEVYLNVGRNHLFEIKSQQKNNLNEVKLMAPENKSNRIFDLDKNTEEDNSMWTWRCETKQLGEEWTQSASGIWRISFIKECPQTVYVKVKVLSQELDSINPILMKCKLNDETENIIPLIIVDLKRGNKAVVGANVVATVDRPNGTAFKVTLDLLDDLYFGYLDQNSCLGEYVVNVSAKSNESTFRRSLFLGTTSRRFQRQQFVGVYYITESSVSAPKGIPYKVINEMRMSFNQKLVNSFSQTKMSSANIGDTPQKQNPQFYESNKKQSNNQNYNNF